MIAVVAESNHSSINSMESTTTTCSSTMKKEKKMDMRKNKKTTNITTRNNNDNKNNNNDKKQQLQKLSSVSPKIVRDKLEQYINASSSSSSSSSSSDYKQVILKRLETIDPNKSKYFIRRSFNHFMNPNIYKRKNPWGALSSKISGKIYRVAVRFLQEQEQRNSSMDIGKRTMYSTTAITTAMNTPSKQCNTAGQPTSRNLNSRSTGTTGSQSIKQDGMKRMSLIAAVKGVNETTVYDSCLEVIHKIENFLKEDGITKSGLCHFLGDVFPNSLHLFLSKKEKNTTLSNLQNDGCSMTCYRRAYIFFEKKRILEKKPKSMERLKNEITYPNGFSLKRHNKSKKNNNLLTTTNKNTKIFRNGSRSKNSNCSTTDTPNNDIDNKKSITTRRNNRNLKQHAMKRKYSTEASKSSDSCSNSKKAKIICTSSDNNKLEKKRNNNKLAKKRKFTNMRKRNDTSAKGASIDIGKNNGLNRDKKRPKTRDNQDGMKRMSLINDVKGVSENAVYDSCLEVISKIEDFLKEDGITKVGLCHFLGNMFPNSLHVFLSTKKKNTISNLQNDGCSMICYRRAYVFFEKKRILENMPKSLQRLKNEIAYPNGFPLVRRKGKKNNNFITNIINNESKKNDGFYNGTDDTRTTTSSIDNDHNSSSGTETDDGTGTCDYLDIFKKNFPYDDSVFSIASGDVDDEDLVEGFSSLIEF